MSYYQIAGTVIRDSEGRYLLVQEKLKKVYGLWNLPAGHVEEGETPSQAAVRETLEEVGLQVELVSDEPVFENFNPERERAFFAFKAKVTSEAPKANTDEVLAAKWWAFTEIEQLWVEGRLREQVTLDAISAVELE